MVQTPTVAKRIREDLKLLAPKQVRSAIGKAFRGPRPTLVQACGVFLDSLCHFGYRACLTYFNSRLPTDLLGKQARERVCRDSGCEGDQTGAGGPGGASGNCQGQRAQLASGRLGALVVPLATL